MMMRKSVAIAIIIEVGTCRDILPWSYEEDDLVMCEITLGHTWCRWRQPGLAWIRVPNPSKKAAEVRNIRKNQKKFASDLRVNFGMNLQLCCPLHGVWIFKGGWPGCSENWIKDLLPDPGKGREHDDWLQHLLFFNRFQQSKQQNTAWKSLLLYHERGNKISIFPLFHINPFIYVKKGTAVNFAICVFLSEGGADHRPCRAGSVWTWSGSNVLICDVMTTQPWKLHIKANAGCAMLR